MSEKRKLSLTERMSRIGKVDTKPELIVRRMAHAMGYRFRLHRRDLPGAPDLVFAGARKVIFVHGCFWHRHTCPDGRKLPRSKPEYWGPKLERNKQRDLRSLAQLRAMGWDALCIWECQLKNSDALRQVLARFLGSGSDQSVQNVLNAAGE
jgi:DNA mismatch endonuclease (patch repair protein)